MGLLGVARLCQLSAAYVADVGRGRGRGGGGGGWGMDLTTQPKSRFGPHFSFGLLWGQN